MKTIDTTATVVTDTSTKTFDRTARENRIAVLAHRDATKGTMKALTGNTWPLKSMLYAYGSLWNKEAKALEVPEHVHAECQAAIDGYAATHPKTPKVKSDKPKAVTAPKAESKPAPVAAIKGTATQATMCKRLANLGEITDTLVTDLLQTGMVDTAASVVKALAIFNQEHANLLK